MVWYWVAWLILGFGVPEAVALATGHPQNTLSDTVWRLCSVKPHQDNPLAWNAAHILMSMFLVWVLLHFVFRIWR